MHISNVSIINKNQVKRLTTIFLSVLFVNSSLFAQAKISNKSMNSETSKSKSASKLYERGSKSVDVTVLSQLSSNNSKFYITPYNKGYVYSEIKKGGNIAKSNDVNFYYVAESNGRFDKPQAFNLNTPTDLIPVAVSFNADETSMFITCLQKPSTSNYTIYQAKKTNGIWSDWKEVAMARKFESAGFPVVNESGTMLYFTAKTKASTKGYDIYSSKLNNGWQDAVPMIGDINSMGDDMYPTLFKDVLFYSSNDKGGEGKSDIIFIDLKDKAKICYNAGSIINTEANEQLMLLNKDNRTGILINDSNDSSKLELFHFKVEGDYISK